MTRYEARRRGLPPGFAIRLNVDQGDVVYLADYRRSKYLTTVYPSESEYFQRLVDAQEMGRRISHVSGQEWVACTIGEDPAVEWEPPLAGRPPLLDEHDAARHATEEVFGDCESDVLDTIADCLDTLLLERHVAARMSDGRHLHVNGNGGVDRG